MSVRPANNVVVLDEAVEQGRVREIDFAGAGVSAAVAGSRATVTIPGGSGSLLAVSKRAPLTSDFTIAADEGVIIPYSLELAAGVTFTIAAGGVLEVS